MYSLNGLQLTRACVHQSQHADQCRHRHECLCMQEMAMCTQATHLKMNRIENNNKKKGKASRKLQFKHGSLDENIFLTANSQPAPHAMTAKLNFM